MRLHDNAWTLAQQFFEGMINYAKDLNMLQKGHKFMFLAQQKLLLFTVSLLFYVVLSVYDLKAMKYEGAIEHPAAK